MLTKQKYAAEENFEHLVLCITVVLDNNNVTESPAKYFGITRRQHRIKKRRDISHHK